MLDGMKRTSNIITLFAITQIKSGFDDYVKLIFFADDASLKMSKAKVKIFNPAIITNLDVLSL